MSREIVEKIIMICTGLLDAVWMVSILALVISVIIWLWKHMIAVLAGAILTAGFLGLVE